MVEETINRSYLETLSFSDLGKIADDYGIDVPEDLDRRFLIAEILEVAADFGDFSEEMIISSDDAEDGSSNLPKNYNETQVDGILRNPAWLFVYWNISEADFLMLKNLSDYSLKLRICSFENPKDTVPEEAFEIQTVNESQEQYVLIPNGKKYLKIELIYVTANSAKVLAFSPVITIPQGSSLLNEWQPGMDENFSEILKLSGMEKVLTNQYKHHRHSFS